MDRAELLATDVATLVRLDVSHGAIVAYTIMFLNEKLMTDEELAASLGKSDRQARRYLRELDAFWTQVSLLDLINKHTCSQQTNLQTHSDKPTIPVEAPTDTFGLEEEALQASQILGLGEDGQVRIYRVATQIVQQMGGFYVAGVLVEAAELVRSVLHRIRRSVVGYLGGTLRNLLQDIRDRRRVARFTPTQQAKAVRRRNEDPRRIPLLYKVANGELTFRDYCRILYPEFAAQLAD